MTLKEVIRSEIVRIKSEQAFEQGFKQGFEQGIKQGFEQFRIRIIQNMLQKDFPIDTIAGVLNLTIEEVMEIKEKLDEQN